MPASEEMGHRNSHRKCDPLAAQVFFVDQSCGWFSFSELRPNPMLETGFARSCPFSIPSASSCRRIGRNYRMLSFRVPWRSAASVVPAVAGLTVERDAIRAISYSLADLMSGISWKCWLKQRDSATLATESSLPRQRCSPIDMFIT